MLSVRSIFAGYSGVEVLKGIEFELCEGKIVSLVGANGAGKTTLMRAISGLIRPHKGKIIYKKLEISGKPPNYIVRLGICQVPEGRQIFPTLSVKQHLMLGTYARRVKRAKLKGLMEEVFAIFPVLNSKFITRAGQLSGGEQQMLAIARALMGSPSILLLDEPSLGLAPILVRTIFETIRDLPSKGISVLLVEQNARTAMQISDSAHVIETGRIVKSGRATDLLGDDEVRRRYLGS